MQQKNFEERFDTSEKNGIRRLDYYVNGKFVITINSLHLTFEQMKTSAIVADRTEQISGFNPPFEVSKEYKEQLTKWRAQYPHLYKTPDYSVVRKS